VLELSTDSEDIQKLVIDSAWLELLVGAVYEIISEKAFTHLFGEEFGKAIPSTSPGSCCLKISKSEKYSNF